MHSGKVRFLQQESNLFPLHTVYLFWEWATLCFVFSCDGSPEDYEPPCFPIMYPDGSECTMFTRSAAACQTDSENVAPREQLNTITSFIDGSQIYGSSSEVAENLRDLNCKYLVIRASECLIFFIPPFSVAREFWSKFYWRWGQTNRENLIFICTFLSVTIEWELFMLIGVLSVLHCKNSNLVYCMKSYV